jgi:hypothetical protein
MAKLPQLTKPIGQTKQSTFHTLLGYIPSLGKVRFWPFFSKKVSEIRELDTLSEHHYFWTLPLPKVLHPRRKKF